MEKRNESDRHETEQVLVASIPESAVQPPFACGPDVEDTQTKDLSAREETAEVTAYSLLAWPIRVAEKAARAVVDNMPGAVHPVLFWETEEDPARYVTTLKVAADYVRSSPDPTIAAVLVDLRLHGIRITDADVTSAGALVWQVYADMLQTIDWHNAAVDAERKLATASVEGILRVPLAETTLERVTGLFDPTF